MDICEADIPSNQISLINKQMKECCSDFLQVNLRLKINARILLGRNGKNGFVNFFKFHDSVIGLPMRS